MKLLEKSFKELNLTNLCVANRRYSTIWGGSSLLNMFLNVIQENLLNDWDYILNLSETDMPLLSIEKLEFNLYRYSFFVMFIKYYFFVLIVT